MVKRINKSLALLVCGIGVSLAFGACANLHKDCEYLLTCVEGDGDGSGGAGDGDGDVTGGNGGEGGSNPCPACADPTPACNADEVCVECTGDEHCNDPTPVCDTGEETCVECLTADSCADPATPMCEGMACASGCTSNLDCTRFDDTPVCDTGSGECVGCTPTTEETDCGAKSCDPATFTCGPHDRSSRSTCRSCVSDSDCQADRHLRANGVSDGHGARTGVLP